MTRLRNRVRITGKYFPFRREGFVSLVVGQNREPTPGFEERWAIAVRLANRRIADAIAKHFLTDKELAAQVAACISDSPFPQLRTLSWLRSVLLRLAQERALWDVPLPILARVRGMRTQQQLPVVSTYKAKSIGMPQEREFPLTPQPNCPHCKSEDITYRDLIRNGAKMVLIFCTKCGAILAAVNRD